jgi:hypothetical protein
MPWITVITLKEILHLQWKIKYWSTHLYRTLKKKKIHPLDCVNEWETLVILIDNNSSRNFRIEDNQVQEIAGSILYLTMKGTQLERGI